MTRGGADRPASRPWVPPPGDLADETVRSYLDPAPPRTAQRPPAPPPGGNVQGDLDAPARRPVERPAPPPPATQGYASPPSPPARPVEPLPPAVEGSRDPALQRPPQRPQALQPGGNVLGYVDAPVRRPEAPPRGRPLEIPGTSQPVRRPVPRPEVARPEVGRGRPGDRGDGPAGPPGRRVARGAPPDEALAPRKGRRVGLVALVLTVALLSGLAGGLVGVVASRNPDLFGGEATASGNRVVDQTAAAAPEGTAAGDQLQRVLGAVLPAVVKIEARSDSGKATGSGVIFAKDGHVLTNAHVVDGARTITVTLSTSEPLRARFVGRDLNTDLAVLRVRRAGLTTAKVGRSADLRVGDAAIVVGSPFGFQSSVTTGIVSALHRVVKVPDSEGGGEGRELVDAIQTDAAINPGNSGGALVNGNGEVVGISTAIATSGDAEANAGVGFAIPVDEALEVARALVRHRPVKVPFLGVEADTELTPEIADRYRLGNRAGALVTKVEARSPAAEAGLRRGDLIVRLGDQVIPARDQLAVAERRSEIGVPVPVTVVRRGRQLILQITPADLPER